MPNALVRTLAEIYEQCGAETYNAAIQNLTPMAKKTLLDQSGNGNHLVGDFHTEMYDSLKKAGYFDDMKTPLTATEVDMMTRSPFQTMTIPKPPLQADKSTDYSADELAKMVRMRLRSNPSSYFDHWHFHKCNRDGEIVVLVMVVNNGQVTMLEDNWALFPSDKLITQLRLLEK